MRRFLILLFTVPLLASPRSAPQGTEFSRLITRLSEGPGFFQSDNLVSNETSYLHVLGAFRALDLSGGAYLGVGPEQSFSYIAATTPKIAFVIDIRRDNMLLHLLMKAMFETSRNRLEYLCQLYGRPVPGDLYLWTDMDLESLIDYIDRTPLDSAVHARNHLRLTQRVARYGVVLNPDDLETVRRFHDEFAVSGLDVRYSTRSRRLRLVFPTNRQLYLATDLDGIATSYLSTEDRWRTVRGLQNRHRILPVVGDLAGPKALRAIGDYLREIGETVSVFYLSNVEQYLFRAGSFPAFVRNVQTLPYRANSVLVRSWFGRGFLLPSTVPGSFSTQIAQTFPQFMRLMADTAVVDYWALVNDGIDLRNPGAPASQRFEQR